MTASELIMCDEFDIWNSNEGIEARKEAVNALEKKEKYRWHNLKEKPDDLPKDNEVCLVFTGSAYLTALYTGNNEWRLDYYDRTQCAPTHCFNAWKYIEPLDEGDAVEE